MGDTRRNKVPETGPFPVRRGLHLHRLRGQERSIQTVVGYRRSNKGIVSLEFQPTLKNLKNQSILFYFICSDDYNAGVIIKKHKLQKTK